jgi:SAM-dependent methyltransferase
MTIRASSNRSKWEFDNCLYRKHLYLYLDCMYAQLFRSGAQNVLDAGCGEGYVYRAMKERSYAGRWAGFDSSPNAIDFARLKSPEVDWHVASIYQIPFEDRSFDLVISSEVLEHLEEPEHALLEMARVSSHYLQLSVPLEPWFRMAARISVALGLGGDPGHVNFWRGAAFRRFLSSAGRVEACERTTVYQIALVDVLPTSQTLA